MKSKQLVIPKQYITDVQPHPEPYGDVIVGLDNGMYTDVYVQETGEFTTLTNNKELIDYVERRKKGDRKMKKYVKIQSSRNIQVTGGLSYLDMSDPKAAIPNKLKVQPLWSKEKIKLKVGTGWYPGHIVEWNTVKSLNKDGVITIGEQANVIPDDVAVEDKQEALDHEEGLKQAQEEINRQKASQKKLKSIAIDDDKKEE